MITFLLLAILLLHFGVFIPVIIIDHFQSKRPLAVTLPEFQSLIDTAIHKSQTIRYRYGTSPLVPHLERQAQKELPQLFLARTILSKNPERALEIWNNLGRRPAQLIEETPKVSIPHLASAHWQPKYGQT